MTANKISIRAATEADLARLKGFEQGVIQAERPFDHTLKPDPIHYYDMQALLNNSDSLLVVAEVNLGGTNQELIGSGYARIEKAKPYVNYSFYSYLGFMYVKPEFRGQGVIQQIIDYLATWSSKQGISMLHLDVFAENQAAIRAYQKAGFQANLVEMRRAI